MKKITPFLILVSLILFSCKQEKQAETPKEVKQYTIEQFYKNLRIGGGAFSPDETKLLVHSDESGIFNLYEINIADASRRQVTNSTQESYFAVDYVPGTNEMLYSADKGGDEIDHIYLLKPDATSQDLTRGEKEKANQLHNELVEKAAENDEKTR